MLFRWRNVFRFSLSKQFTLQSDFSRFTDMKKKWKMVVSCRVELERKSCRKVAISNAKWNWSCETKSSLLIGIKVCCRFKGGADNSIQCFRTKFNESFFETCFVSRQREHQTTIIRNTYEKHLVHIILSDYVRGAGLKEGVHDNLSLQGNCRTSRHHLWQICLRVPSLIFFFFHHSIFRVIQNTFLLCVSFHVARKTETFHLKDAVYIHS